MRIIFMGTPEFSVPCLKIMLEHGLDVAGVFTQPDRPKGRGNKPTPSPVKIAAEEAGVPVFQPEKIRRDGAEVLKRLKPDLCVTAAFGQILSQEILDIPLSGSINVHASLLPKHRGAAPIAYAIMDGDRTTGVTTMYMDAGIDTGDMLLQDETEIGDSETCGELTGRLSVMGAELLMRTIHGLETDTIKRIPQNEAEMTYDPMLNKSMGIADFSKDANSVRGLINGLNPWPCVSIPLGDNRIKLLRAVCTDVQGEPGTVAKADPKNGLIINCGKGAVKILEMQASGGKRMRPEDYLRGHSIPVGTNLKEGTA